MNENTRTKYLVCDANSVQYFEQSTTKTLPVMCVVDFGKPEESAFALPLRRTILLNPMTCNGKITISITGLPRITGDVYGSANSSTLDP